MVCAQVFSDGDGLSSQPLYTGTVRQSGTDVAGRRVVQCRMIFDTEDDTELHRVV